MSRTSQTSTLTQRHLAEALNISYLTVNRALSGHAAVSAATRRRVLEEADRLGYRVNHMARSLKMKKTFSIGLVGCNTAHSFWADILARFEVCCRENGYHVMVCHRLPGESSNRCAEFLISRGVDGIVIAPDDAAEDPVRLKRIVAGTPVLFLNSYITDIPAMRLGTNSRDGMRRLGEHLLELGHRDFCFISGPECDYTGQQRLAGLKDALAKLDADACKLVVNHVPTFCQEDGVEMAGRISDSGTLPTAIVCANDALAIGVSLELTRRGIRIPEDVSVAGYSGMREATLLRAPLTTVAQPVFELGQLCAKLIMSRIAEPEGPVTFTEVEDTLVIRQSTGAPRNSNQKTSPAGIAVARCDQ